MVLKLFTLCLNLLVVNSLMFAISKHDNTYPLSFLFVLGSGVVIVTYIYLERALQKVKSMIESIMYNFISVLCASFFIGNVLFLYILGLHLKVILVGIVVSVIASVTFTILLTPLVILNALMFNWIRKLT